LFPLKNHSGGRIKTEAQLLKKLGWNSQFEEEFKNLNQINTEPGRIVLEERRYYNVTTAKGTLRITLPGKAFHRAVKADDLPVTGDWVAIDRENRTISAILTRSTLISRKAPGTRKKIQVRKSRFQRLAANVNTVFIVNGLDEDYNIRRIERYLTLIKGSGAGVVIFLNKSDLCKQTKKRLQAVKETIKNVPVYAGCAHKFEDLLSILRYLKPGQTSVLLGSSGVGKSTIINTLLGHERQVIQSISAKFKKGRHTTTQRELIILPQGGIIIDTPGLREIQLFGDADDLAQVFPEVAELAKKCRFNDCNHNKEPNCAVKIAVDQGNLDPERLKHYRKMKAEMLNSQAQA
jgi:ribosome biogenesis GTPase